MTLKIVRKQNGRRPVERLEPCANVTFTELDDSIKVELSMDGGKPPKVLSLPDDADIVYVLNDLGRTVDTKRWPRVEPPIVKEFRA